MPAFPCIGEARPAGALICESTNHTMAPTRLYSSVPLVPAGIIVEAYSPLTPITAKKGGPLDPVVQEIAVARGVTPGACHPWRWSPLTAQQVQGMGRGQPPHEVYPMLQPRLLAWPASHLHHSSAPSAPAPPLSTLCCHLGHRAPGEVLLRWSLQSGYLPVTTSKNPDRLRQFLRCAARPPSEHASGTEGALALTPAEVGGCGGAAAGCMAAALVVWVPHILVTLLREEKCCQEAEGPVT